MIIAGGIDLSVGSIICISAVTTSYLDDVRRASASARPWPSRSRLSLVVGLGQGLVITWLRRPAVRGDAGLDAAAARGRRGADRRHRHRLPGQVPRLPLPGRRDRRSACRCRSGSRSAAIAITAFLMHRTLFGRYCYAIGSNAEAARLSGVPVQWIRLVTFVGQRRPVRRRGHPLRRLPAERHTVARLGLRAARGRGGGAGRLLAAGRPGLGVRRAHRRRHHADHLQRREPGRQVAVAERGRGRRDPGGRHRRPRVREEPHVRGKREDDADEHVDEHQHSTSTPTSTGALAEGQS